VAKEVAFTQSRQRNFLTVELQESRNRGKSVKHVRTVYQKMLETPPSSTRV